MGFRYFDQYSLLHFSVAVVLYFWGFRFDVAFILHTLFEFFENTKIGVKLINKFSNSSFILKYPGGKPEPDSIQNIIGDTISFVLGYFVIYNLDSYGIKHNWYYN